MNDPQNIFKLINFESKLRKGKAATAAAWEHEGYKFYAEYWRTSKD